MSSVRRVRWDERCVSHGMKWCEARSRFLQEAGYSGDHTATRRAASPSGGSDNCACRATASRVHMATGTLAQQVLQKALASARATQRGAAEMRGCEMGK